MNDLLYFLKQIHTYSGKILYFNLFAMTVIGLLDGIGILLLVPMLSMSGIVHMDLGDTKLTPFFELFQSIPATFGLLAVLGIFILVVISQGILSRYTAIKNAIIQHSFFQYMRVETYDALLHANWNYFIKRRRSDLVNIMTAEITRASTGIYSFLEFTAAFIFSLIQIGLAFWLSPTITTCVLLFGAILLFMNRHFFKRSYALGKRNYELGREHIAGITDQLHGIKDIKSNTLESSRMTWYMKMTDKMRQRHIDYTKLASKSQLYYRVASALLIGLFIFVALTLFNAQSGKLMIIIVIFSRLWPTVSGLQGSLEQIAATIPSFKAVKDVQKESKAAREFPKQVTAPIERIKIEKNIECRNVTFRYNDHHRVYALKNINITIPANKMTAIVGKSGAGKSTLIDLLMGLNRPESGEVLYDGKLLTDNHLLSLRHSMSYVPQDPFLFNATIRENLTLVDENATETDMWEALEFSSAAHFVKKLTDGLDTVIGDRGITLSGGERQRLVLARAILRKPAILVLDEATSALDTENEMKIQHAIEGLKGRMTIIVIAHRLSTIRHADQVIVLDEGKVVQTGGFTQLSKAKQGVFKEAIF